MACWELEQSLQSLTGGTTMLCLPNFVTYSLHRTCNRSVSFNFSLLVDTLYVKKNEIIG